MKLDGKRIVTRDGRVFHETQTARGPLRTELKPRLASNGYLIVDAVDDEGQHTIYNLHALVAREFLPPRPSPQSELRHLNGNRFDNRANNLAWGTHAENMADAKAHGTIKAAAQLTAARRHIHNMEIFDWSLEEARCAHEQQQQAKTKLHAKLERWRHDAHASTPPNNTSPPTNEPPTTER